MKQRILVTGGAGFYGSSFIRKVLNETDYEVVALCRPSYGGTYSRLSDLLHMDRLTVAWHDLRSPIHYLLESQIGQFDYIFHIGASSHVDRSIERPEDFVLDNVLGTTHILQFARKQYKLKKFFYFSTDEVFGSAGKSEDFKEWDRYKSGNPYAATKAGGEEMALAFHNTYKVPVIITHTMNLFGAYQHPEKFIPKVIRSVLSGTLVTIHADPSKTYAGSRKYIHVDNVTSALMFLMDHGKSGEKYNIVGEQEVDNLQMAQMIAGYLGKPLRYELVDFHGSRPGHDMRYSLDGTKLKDMGFEFVSTFGKSLNDTIDWYLEHKEWIS